MSLKVEVRGLARVTAKFRDLAAKATRDGNVSVAVGYTAKYALAVHENLQMKWRGLPRDRSVRLDRKQRGLVRTGYSATKKKGLFWGPRGQAKFLEGPAREMASELARIVYTAVAQGKTLAQGLVLAGLRLQRESQDRVPVDMGILRASAFTRLEVGNPPTTL